MDGNGTFESMIFHQMPYKTPVGCRKSMWLKDDYELTVNRLGCIFPLSSQLTFRGFWLTFTRRKEVGKESVVDFRKVLELFKT